MTTQREVIALYEARGIHPGRAPEADPGLEKARRGRRKWILGSAGLWRPRGSLAPASSDGALPAASTTALRDPLRGRPLRSGLSGCLSAPYGRARLVVAGGRMSSGPLVRRLTEPFGRKPCSRGGRPSRTPPSARRGTASPPPADFEKLPYEVAGQQFDVGPPGEERPEVLRKARIVGQMRIDRGGS